MEQITINLKGGEAKKLCAGFGEALEGKRFSYHSYHPGAGEALLLRAREGMNRLRWNSGEAEPGSQAEFVMLCAIASGKGGSHRFTLSAGGKPSCAIFTGDEGGEPRVEGLNGCEARFEERLIDAYGDRHGLLYLKPGWPGGGARMSFELEAEAAGSDDWFILYQYEFARYPRVVWEPVLLAGNVPLQALRVTQDNLFGTGDAEISREGKTLGRLHNADEIRSVRIGIPIRGEEYQMEVRYELDGVWQRSEEIAVRPTVPREVHILPFSHNDIGYTDLQENVLRRQEDNIRTALSEARRTRGYPEEAQARWNLEVLWALEDWWAKAGTEEKGEFLDAVRSGHIGLNALHNNLLSGLCHEEELHRHLDFAREFSEETGIAVETAAVTDIPGFVWGIVEALQAAGVKYFALAPNSGDRVGNIYRQADQPFYWEAPDGKARVLTWIMGAGYAMFHRERIGETGLKKALGYLERLQDTGYPHEIAPLSYTIGGDNGTPDEGLPEFVRDWNEKHASPRWVISTHAMFFQRFMSRNGEGIPVMRGDMTPHWEDGAASTARETKLSRNAADRLQLAQRLFERLRPQELPDFSEAWRKVIFFDEHTWGAWNSVSEPDSESVRSQWEFKRQFALDADRMSRELLDRFTRLDAADIEKGCFPVYNPSGEAGGAMIVLTGEFDGGEVFLDAEGAQYPQQQLYNGRTAIWAEFRAGEARKIVRIERGGWQQRESLSAETAMSSQYFNLEADPETCSVRSLKLADGRELLEGSEGLLRYLYMRGTDRNNLLGVKGGRMLVHSIGEICSEMVLAGEAPGCESYSALLRLFHNEPRLDLEVRLDKAAVRDPESVHIAFPFAEELGILRYDGAGTLIQPELDQLPAACRNFFCPEGLADISSKDRGISVLLLDTPLIEIGGITAELPWMERLDPAAKFYAYAMNNYWHTNYKADQSGEVSFRFTLYAHTAERADEIRRRSRRFREGWPAGI